MPAAITFISIARHYAVRRPYYTAIIMIHTTSINAQPAPLSFTS